MYCETKSLHLNHQFGLPPSFYFFFIQLKLLQNYITKSQSYLKKVHCLWVNNKLFSIESFKKIENNKFSDNMLQCSGGHFITFMQPYILEFFSIIYCEVIFVF